MAFFLGKMNGKFVHSSGLNSPDFAAKFLREICYLPKKKGKVKFNQIFKS